MAPLKVAGSPRIMRRFVAGMFALFCTLGLARSGYGQVDKVGELISELKYSDPGVRLSAVEALARIGDSRATEPLIAALSDTDPGVRESAALGLGVFRDPRSIEPLIVSLRDLDGHVRRGAVIALGIMKDLRAVKPLIAALKDPDPQVRHAAVGALRHIGDRRAAEPIKLALNDPDFDAQEPPTVSVPPSSEESHQEDPNEVTPTGLEATFTLMPPTGRLYRVPDGADMSFPWDPVGVKINGLAFDCETYTKETAVGRLVFTRFRRAGDFLFIATKLFGEIQMKVIEEKPLGQYMAGIPPPASELKCAIWATRRQMNEILDQLKKEVSPRPRTRTEIQQPN